MAVYEDPKKKQASGLLVDGKPGLSPIQGSGLDSTINAITSFRNKNQAVQAGANAMTRASKLHFINPADPVSMQAAPPSLNAAPLNRAQPAPAPAPAQTPIPQRTTAPLDQASRDEVAARTQAPNTSRPADVGASLPAGAGGTDIVGTFNGRQITRAQSDALAGKLPTASGPVAAGPNGSFAYAVGGQPAAAGAPMLERQNTAAGFAPVAPQAAPADLRAANEADAKLRSDIGSQLFRLSFAAGRPGREGRAAQQAMTQLMGLQQGSVEGQGKRAVDIAGGDRNAVLDTNRTTAGLATSDADRLLRAQQGSETLQLQREGQNKGGQVLTGDDGTASLLRPDGSLAPLTSQDGGAFRPRQSEQANQRNYGQEADDALFADILKTKVDGTGQPLPNAVELAQADVAKSRSLRQQSSTPTAAQIVLLKANPNKAADFDALYGKGAAAKLLGK